MNRLTKGKALVGGIDVPLGELSIAGTAVTASADEINILDGVTTSTEELNILDGVTVTAAEINLVDGSVAGTAVASKALVLGANKNVDVLAVADLKLGAGAGTSVTSTAAELNLLAGTDRIVRFKAISLAAVDDAGGVFAWSPGAAALIKDAYIDLTTKATGACTLDVGIANDGTTLSDTLIDGLDINSATGLFNSHQNGGVNGLPYRRCGATQYVTGSVASGASAGIVGNVYIEYILL